METINNVASGVSKVIWGEGATAQNNETAGTEPISGETGKGTVDSPYDQGNSETATGSDNKPIGLYNDNKTSTTTDSTSTDPTTSATTGTTSGISTTNVPGGSETAKPLETTDKTGVTSSTPGDPTKASDITPSNAQTNTGVPESTKEEKEEGKAKAEEKQFSSAEEAMKSRDPNDHSGEPMHMHDGAGSGSGSGEKKIPETQEERRESKVGMPGGQPHGKEQGTGEKVVHASGLASEGGDFDASNPGAGSEANRMWEKTYRILNKADMISGLMEEKGIKGDDSGNNTATKSSSSEPKKEGGKLSAKVDKLKEKLHIGHKDK